MSLEQHKDANRTELWNILQIQAQVLEEEIRKNTELEKELRNSTELLVKGANKIKELEEREGLLKKLLYCCDGLSTEYAQNNHGEVKEWLRHVDAAYQALKESKS